MRCPKCGSELDLQLMECDRCGLATPKSKPPTDKSGKLPVSGKLAIPSSGKTAVPPSGKLPVSPSGRLAVPMEKPPKTWLPKFLANSPLNKINIPPALVVILVLLIPALAGGYYFMNEAGVCLGCTQIGGNYTTELTVDEQQIKLDVLLYQYGSAITGQVRFSPKIDVTDKTARKQLFVETIDQITVNKKEVLFQSKGVKFSGLVGENNTLQGNLIVNMPEINCNGKTFAISVKK